ncbi:MAG: type 4a pilus biogenesis protein PilO [Pseudomonadota bacterium]
MALQDSLEQLRNFDVNDLDVNNMGSWPSPVKGIIMALVLFIVLLLGYQLYLSDKRDMIEQKEREHAQLREDYQRKHFKAANLDAYRRQKKEMEATFGTLLRQLPSDTEVPGLLEDITRAALDNALTIESIKLEPERRSEFYVELPIDITVLGDYHMLGSFVSSVADLSRIVTLHDFEIAPTTGPTLLRMSITAKTYRYLDQEDG